MDEANELYDLCNSIVDWWKEHEFDTDNTGERNVYDEEPKFVRTAKLILEKEN